MLAAHVDSLATWSSTAENSLGCTEDARRRHCWKDAKHWMAQMAMVGPFASRDCIGCGGNDG